jgi:hypothetical protein
MGGYGGGGRMMATDMGRDFPHLYTHKMDKVCAILIQLK